MNARRPTEPSEAIDVRTGDWATLGAAAGALRNAVFVHEQGIPARFEWDEWDPRSVHCVAWRGGEAVGTGRLLPDGRIGRMAVRIDQRGRGVGRRVLEALVAVATARGDASIELSAQQQVEAFYRAQGFEPVGEPYDEVGIRHVKMRRSLLALAMSACLATLGAFGMSPAQAGALDAISNADATSALRATLERGAGQAVAQLGKAGGFLDNPKVRIPLPGFLEDGAKMLRKLGQGKRVDQLVNTMNQAAENAVPLGKDVLLGAVRTMSVADAKKILSGSDNSVTQFFAEKTRSPLSEQFLPVVKQATSQVGLAEQYNRVAGQASKLGLLKGDNANIEQYVTGKSLDGLYTIIGDEERKLRQNPAAAGSALLQKVFGSLK